MVKSKIVKLEKNSKQSTGHSSPKKKYKDLALC